MGQRLRGGLAQARQAIEPKVSLVLGQRVSGALAQARQC